MGLSVQRTLRFNGLLDQGLWYRHWSRAAARVQRVQKVQRVQRVQRGRNRPAGDKYEVSVTGFTFMSTLLHNGVL